MSPKAEENEEEEEEREGKKGEGKLGHLIRTRYSSRGRGGKKEGIRERNGKQVVKVSGRRGRNVTGQGAESSFVSQGM